MSMTQEALNELKQSFGLLRLAAENVVERINRAETAIDLEFQQELTDWAFKAEMGGAFAQLRMSMAGMLGKIKEIEASKFS